MIYCKTISNTIISPQIMIACRAISISKGDSTMVKFLITLFFGFFGVHKFMEKKTGLGFLYLFTLGLFGVGWIYDTLKAFVAIGKNNKEPSDTNFQKSNYTAPQSDSSYESTDNDNLDDDLDNGHEDNHINFSVAGVTFKNDDGSERQTILKNFYDNRGYTRKNVEFKKYKYKDEDAIAIYAKGQMIGNVPREHISKIIENWDTYKIYHFRVKLSLKGIYYSTIDLFLK